MPSTFHATPAAPAIGPASHPPTLRPLENFVARLAGKLDRGALTLRFPSGVIIRVSGRNPGPEATMHIRRWRLLWRLLVAGDIGLAESYRDGDWDTPDLTAVLSLGLLNRDQWSKTIAASRIASAWHRIKHMGRANTRSGSRRNIQAHYDLGNDFYRLWLDETMTYSAGLFSDPAEALAAAQHRKYRALAESIDLKAGERVLEIGCGWGGFAEHAARAHGCSVTGLTLSDEQAAFARSRITSAGLDNQVEIRLQDYRDVSGQFDKVVSIEMFEAVGEKNWPTYFETLRRSLRPGGKAALQVITINDQAFETYRQHPDFIQMFIFPGGMLPSPGRLAAAVTDAGLDLTHATYFGLDYAETLRRWARTFKARSHDVRALGFDTRFQRLWEYYLCYCEAGFEQAHVDVGHFVVERS